MATLFVHATLLPAELDRAILIDSKHLTDHCAIQLDKMRYISDIRDVAKLIFGNFSFGHPQAR